MKTEKVRMRRGNKPLGREWQIEQTRSLNMKKKEVYSI